MARQTKAEGPPALDLIEETVHLLRTAPAGVLGCYFIGTLPFVLGFLFFWSDMSRSAFALERCAPMALMLALLFVWMKTWQAIFARQLRACLCGEPPPPISLRRLWRVAVTQSAIQPTAFLVLPPALLVMLPFGWTYAFYQNTTAIGGDEDAEFKPVFRNAWRQASLWPRGNRLVLGLLLAFAIVVFINLAVGLIYIPALLKMLAGIETPFSLSHYTILNTTFFAIVASLTYLCVDPIAKAFYVLRCFHGFSIRTGEDLRLGLRRSLSPALLIAALSLLIASPALAAAEPAPVEREAAAVAPAELNRAIEDVLQQRQYTWRLPRERLEEPEASKNWLDRFMEDVRNVITGWMMALKERIVSLASRMGNLIEWLLRKLFGDRNASGFPGSGAAMATTVKVILVTVLVVAAAAGALLLWRAWRQRSRNTDILAQAVTAIPDLTDEGVAADQLPEDGWLNLARELMEKGELRLALRAFYLASLAHLARREMISIARFKSNREYELELRRRARALPDLQNAFSQNVALFERVWYGMHHLNEELLRQFRSNLERIQTC